MNNSDKIKKTNRNKSPFWYYLVLILIPILFFVLLEIILRIFNYGRNDDQWIKITETKHMLNPDVAGRYFFNLKKRLVTSDAGPDKAKSNPLHSLDIWSTFRQVAISLELLRIIIMLPLGVLAVVCFRNLIGIETFGTSG